MKSLITLISVFIFSTSLLYSQDNIKELTIFHWNDFHARNLPYKKTRIKDGDTTKYFVGGTASMLGYLNKYRDNKSLVLNAGDDYQGSPISSITRGFSQIKLLNLYNLDAFAPGNHDFDYGQYALDSALMLANFPAISANAFLIKQNKLFAKSNIIKEINGIKIGIIGLSPEELMTLTLPANVSDLILLNRDSVIYANIKELKNNDCSLIILVSHNGVDKDSLYAAKYSNDINIIIGGHSHTRLFKPKVVNGVLICQAASYGEYLGKLDLIFDITGKKITEYNGQLIETKFDSTIYDKNAMAIVEEMESEIRPEMQRVIGELTVDWKKSGNMAQWHTDMMRIKSKTDIGFLNAGGIRKDMKKGSITVGDIWEINPFDNTVNTFSVTGAQLKIMLSNCVFSSKRPENVLISGVKIFYSKEKLKAGSEDYISAIEINGQPLDESKSYSVSTNNYVVSQFPKYFGLQPDGINFYDTNIIFRNMIMEAVTELKQISTEFEERVINTDK